ncbi:DUF1648 domain-containing protein [Paenibacillus sp. S150]|uniref:DUF1648 domain-containing protein n=1 Tax=Paenibacillus sp. S150 TaxID=2749826 RepID=UPI001C5A47E1|nr:DUF1648 domain-containing protein [Paenibacillus sp. S150]MBW4081528.1 DUF1648 domain-containing protein [Paenibacillus sp. S150]
MRKNMDVYATAGLILITLIINVIAYPHLPDKVGIHMQSGEIDSYLSKAGFVALLPGIQIIASVITKLTRKSTVTLILLNVIALGLDAFLIFKNI